MFTIDCEDPNCMGCKQAGKEPSSKEGSQSTMTKTVEEISEEGNQSKIPETAGQSSEEEVKRKLIRTIERTISAEFYNAKEARFLCLSKLNILKTRVINEINELVMILKERERELLATIEGEYCGQMREIDNDLTYSCIDKILNRRTTSSSPKSTLIYNSDFETVKKSLASFGKLTRPERPKPSKMETAKQLEMLHNIFHSAALSSTKADAKATSGAKNAESVSTNSIFNAAQLTLTKLEIETEIALKEASRDSEKMSCGLKEIGEEIDSQIKLHGRPPVDSRLKSLEDITRKVEEEILSLKERKCTESKAPLIFRQPDPKVNEEDSKIIVEDQVSEDPQTMSAEERRRRREMHVLKVRQQREKELKLLKMHQEKGAQCVPLKLTIKDDPKTLSGQIEKRMGAIARKAAFAKTLERVEARKRRNIGILDLENDQKAKKDYSYELEYREMIKMLPEMVIQPKFYKDCGSVESIDSMPNKVPENNNSLKKGFSEKIQDEVEFIYSQGSEASSQSSESTDSSSSEEAEKDSSLDEDDIEIISRLETESIPSDLEPSPPLPPKSRFKFGGKPSCFASLLRKKADRKPNHSPINSAKSESSGIGESESKKSSSSSAEPSGSNAEVKESPAFQESSSECLDDSKDVGPGNDPTLALRSSLAKYLEKDPESEWLATGKSSDQPKSAENGTKERVVPIFIQELDQWLPAGFNRRNQFSAFANWRHTDCDWLFNADK